MWKEPPFWADLLNLGTYSCTCKPGFISTDGTNDHGAAKCEDMNECDLGSNDGINMCPRDAHCSNFDGLTEFLCLNI